MQHIHVSRDWPMNGWPGASAGTLGTMSFQHTDDWQARAVEAHRRAEADGSASFGSALALAVHRLTGQTIPPEMIVEDRGRQWATATVDGVTFRLSRQGLMLLRACAYCGTGRFESIPLQNEVDLGFALDVWRPLHRTCEQCGPDEMMDG